MKNCATYMRKFFRIFYSHHMKAILYFGLLVLVEVALRKGSATKCTSHLSYHLLEKFVPFIEAKKACTDARNGSLPTFKRNNPEFLRIMQENNIQRVWVGTQRRMMSEWQWVDNSSLKNCLPSYLHNDDVFNEDSHDRCAILDIPRRNIIPFPCFSKHICFVCSLRDSAACDNLHFKRCIKHMNAWIAIGYHPHSWYSARKQCRRYDGDLVTITTATKLDEIINGVEMPPKKFDCDKLFIGLRLDRWVNISPFAGKMLIDDELWLEDEPLKEACAELVINDNQSMGLKTLSCFASSHVICTYLEVKPVEVCQQHFQEEKPVISIVLVTLLCLFAFALLTTIFTHCYYTRKTLLSCYYQTVPKDEERTFNPSEESSLT